MRRGLVSLLIAVIGMAQAQGQQATGRTADYWHFTPENTGLMRADGSNFGNPSFGRPRVEKGPAAISFHHYVHKPSKDALGNYSKAMKAAQANRGGEALDRLSDAIRLDPEFFEAHLQAGIIWIQEESPERALAHFERALLLDSSSQPAQALAAWALLQLGRPAEAELALHRSMQLGPSLPVFDDLLRYAKEQRGYAATTKESTP